MSEDGNIKRQSAPTYFDAKRRFESFLKEYKVEGQGVPYTHTAYGPPWGKFNIPDDKMDKFLKIYYDALQARVPLHITEKPKKVGQLLLDIDFNFDKKKEISQFDNDNNSRYYKLDDIQYIIAHMNHIIRKYYNWNSKVLTAFVFEKETATVKRNKETGATIYKDGFHIVYPFLAVSEGMRYLIIHELKKKIKNTNGFRHIPFTNSLNDVFDMSVIKNNGWMMYGSRKHDGPWYTLTHVFKCTLDEEDKGHYNIKDLLQILSNRKFSDNDEVKFKSVIDSDELQDTVNQILSKYGVLKDNKNNNNNNNKKEYVNNNFIDEDSDEDNSSNEDDDDDDDDEGIDEIESIRHEILERRREQNRKDAIKNKKAEGKLAKKLVAILSKERAINYHDWIRVGWALYNINTNLLETFKNFSKKAGKKYNEKSCEKVWEKCRNDGGFTIASLRHWARQDNPEKYSELLTENVNELIVEAESGTEYDVAKVVHELYRELYKCTSIKHDTWYEFQGHRWVNVEGGYTLSTKLSEDITKEFAILNTVCMQQYSSRTGSDKDSFIKRSTNILKIMTNLKKSGFKDRVIKECKGMFYDSTFEEKLDSNKTLIGFDNGVYDLESRKFRPGCPDDMLSLTVGYDYENYSMDHEYVVGIQDFFSKVQRETDMRDYILTLMASYLDGYTKDEKFILWTGSGCHAAGTQIMMFDGSLKKVEDVMPGDLLMGDDYTSRKVKHLYRGKDKMYRINQKEHNSYVVNGDHRLALRFQGETELYYEVPRRRYVVTWYSFDDLMAIKKNHRYFSIDELEKANVFFKEIERDENVLKKDHILVVPVNLYLKLNNSIQEKLYGYKSITKDKYNCYPINIQAEGVDDYYGFELTDNQRYLMHDKTVTCNSNGKSKTVELFQMAFGEYCGVLPVTFLTQKRSGAGAATPELAQQRGRRFVVFQEPENNDKIQVGYMKELTGGDWVYARPLFKDPIRFKPQFKLLLTCNRLPQIPSTDGGTWRRLRVSPWESEFVDDPKQPHQFAKDYDILEKLELWKKAFLWLLLHKYYPIYKEQGLKEPAKVTEFTRKYKKQSDMFFEFIDSTLSMTKDNKDIERWDVLYAAFKTWYSESYSGKCPFARKDLTEYCMNNNYKVDKTYLYGVAFKSEETTSNNTKQALDE